MLSVDWICRTADCEFHVMSPVQKQNQASRIINKIWFGRIAPAWRPRTSESELPQGCFQESKSVEGGETLPRLFKKVLLIFSVKMRSVSYFFAAVMLKRTGYQKLSNASRKHKGWLRPHSYYPSMTLLPPLHCASLVSLLKSRI